MIKYILSILFLVYPLNICAQEIAIDPPKYEIQINTGILWLGQVKAATIFPNNIYLKYRYSTMYLFEAWEHSLLAGKVFGKSDDVNFKIGAGVTLFKIEDLTLVAVDNTGDNDDEDDKDDKDDKDVDASFGGTFETDLVWYIYSGAIRVGVNFGMNGSINTNGNEVFSLNTGIIFGFL